MTDQLLLGVDTGGTFTDFILLKNGKIRLHKVLSTPSAPEEAILEGISDLGLNQFKDQMRVVHGTTVATNAALERKGVKTAYITNRGFKDVLTIGRQAREELYNLQPTQIAPPVPENLCLETGGRISAQGEELEPLTDKDIDELICKVQQLRPEAIAINLLFSFVDDAHEKQLQAALKDLAYVCRSSEVLPEIREYERGIATWYNAYLGPLVDSYMRRLKSALDPAPISIMQSSGGTISLEQAASKAANLLLSGPAGGLAAGVFLGKLKKQPKMLSFDMGGTSTDVALLDGEIRLTSEGGIGAYPIALPMVDMHTIGAGGGSIAYLDSASLLHVGPASAGASPGPACYGQGGTAPTVTDANAVLGRLQPDNFLGGRMNLDLNSAKAAVGPIASQLAISLEDCALGILDLANEHMTQALRVISEQRGHDPTEYTLVGFGGAGGLHICALSNALGISQAMVPVYGGVFSAFGMLVAPQTRELSHSYLHLLNASDARDIEANFNSLINRAIQELSEEGVQREDIQIRKSVDCRYKGQSFTLNLEWQNTEQCLADFHEKHKSTYGHNFDIEVELVNLRISARVKQQGIELTPIEASEKTGQPVFRKIWARDLSGALREMPSPMIQREEMPVGAWMGGPALICETSATIWVEPEWKVMRDSFGNLILEKQA